ncbi:MAG: phosphoribosylformylglycinamidine synthase subunit PurQ [Bacteroidota bacterium]
MKFGVVTFPGSNCDEDLFYSLSHNLGQPVVKLWHKERDLQGCDFIFLPGGFSYGDYLRCGAIARFSPIMECILDHSKQGGYIMGICNGFQILCEAGLLPGALLRNASMNFVCKNVFLTPGTHNSLLTHNLAKAVYKVPVAHAEGNFVCSHELLKELQENDQVLFRYCDSSGSLTSVSNPNGSLDNIAGICNRQRNVFGMMPHPERATDELLHNTDGKLIFESILESI